jgi:predicted RNase H-like HicB family nuclease
LRNIHLVYRPEGSGWAVSSPNAPDYIAYAASLAEARQLAHEGIAFHFDVGEEELQITDLLTAEPGIVSPENVTISSGMSLSTAFGIAVNVGEVVVPSTAPTALREASVRVEQVSAA